MAVVTGVLYEAASLNVIGAAKADAIVLRVKGSPASRCFFVDSEACNEWLEEVADEVGISPSGSDFLKVRRRLRTAYRKGAFPDIVVGQRVVQLGNEIWIDRGSRDGTSFRVSPGEWSAVSDAECPVGFLRTESAQALPAPSSTGVLDALRVQLRVDDRAWISILSWQVMALLPDLTCPMLYFFGAKGASKSFTSRLVLTFVDPRRGGLAFLPGNRNDLISMCRSRRVAAFENVSNLSTATSDTLCGLVTGAAGAKRKLFSDFDEATVSVRRPMLANGINLPEEHSDLMDRIVAVRLLPIDPSERLPESKLLGDAELRAGDVMAGLLDLVAGVLQDLPNTHRDSYGRMADFERVYFAVGRRLGRSDDVLQGYLDLDKSERVEGAIDSSVPASILRSLLDEKSVLQSTPSELTVQMSHHATKVGKWGSDPVPKTPQHLMNSLNRQEADLDAQGYHMERFFLPNRNKTRMVRLWKGETKPDVKAFEAAQHLSKDLEAIVRKVVERAAQEQKIETVPPDPGTEAA